MVPQEGQFHCVCSGNTGMGLQVTADVRAEGLGFEPDGLAL